MRRGHQRGTPAAACRIGPADGAPPRLPMGVLRLIALCMVAAHPHPKKEARRLARTCRAWWTVLHCHIVLPHVALQGAEASRAFSWWLEKDVLGLRSLAALHTRTLTLRQPAAPQALFDGVTHTRRFGKQTCASLQEALRQCSSLQAVHIQCEPWALDVRKGDNGLRTARASLKEVVCMQSPWAGDCIDQIWYPGHSEAPWTSLTHLQLHGPRSQLSVRTAEGLGCLPRLSHLALVLPVFVGETPGKAARVLGALLDHATHLTHVLLIGHDEPRWAGYAAPLRRAVSQLRVHTQRDVQVTLVTGLAPSTSGEPTRHAHPSVYSTWMFARAAQGTHWDFANASDAMAYTRETWHVPYAPRPVRREPPPAVPERAPAMPTSHVLQERATDEVWGIDNLD